MLVHIIVDNLLRQFDLAGIQPKIEEIDKIQNKAHKEINLELKLCLDSIKLEIESLEEDGYRIISLSKGTLSWRELGTRYEWSLSNNKLIVNALETA